MRGIVVLLIISIFSSTIYAKSLKQATEHEYTTERYYLGIDSDRVIERKMQQARARGDVKAQVDVVCIDIRNFYENVIALNKANRHFNPKKIDTDTQRHQKLLNQLTRTNECL